MGAVGATLAHLFLAPDCTLCCLWPLAAHPPPPPPHKTQPCAMADGAAAPATAGAAAPPNPRLTMNLDDLVKSNAKPRTKRGGKDRSQVQERRAARAQAIAPVQAEVSWQTPNTAGQRESPFLQRLLTDTTAALRAAHPARMSTCPSSAATPKQHPPAPARRRAPRRRASRQATWSTPPCRRRAMEPGRLRRRTPSPTCRCCHEGHDSRPGR